MMGRHRGAIPTFQRYAIRRTLEAVHFAGGRHGFVRGRLRQPARAVLIDHQADLRLLACLRKLLRRKAERRDRGDLSVRGATSNFANL